MDLKTGQTSHTIVIYFGSDVAVKVTKETAFFSKIQACEKLTLDSLLFDS